MTDIDLDALEATARAATPAPWAYNPTILGLPSTTVMAESKQLGYVAIGQFREQDATHVAAFDPPTVLALIARLREAEAAIEAIDAIEPMWPRGMYGCPQDMIGRNQIRPILATYKTTKAEGTDREDGSTHG
jgi:hypothetical protein